MTYLGGDWVASNEYSIKFAPDGFAWTADYFDQALYKYNSAGTPTQLVNLPSIGFGYLSFIPEPGSLLTMTALSAFVAMRRQRVRP
jgi:hypothetical protein